MKHKSLKQAKDNEWIQPKMSGYLMGCCDCGLVHIMDFKVIKGYRKGNKKLLTRIIFRARRARNYTARLRKKKGIRIRK